MMSAFGTKRTFCALGRMSAFDPKQTSGDGEAKIEKSVGDALGRAASRP